MAARTALSIGLPHRLIERLAAGAGIPRSKHYSHDYPSGMVAQGCLNVASSWDWGSVPEWIGGIGTLAAAIVALWIFAAGKADARTQNARLVYATIERSGVVHNSTFSIDAPGVWLMERGVLELLQTDQRPTLIRVIAEVHNNSPEVMHHVLIGLSGDSRIPEPTGFVLKSVPPNEAVTLTFLLLGERLTPDGTGAQVPDLALRPVITFSDSAGMHWHRDGTSAVSRIRSGYPTSPNDTIQFGLRKIQIAHIYPGTETWPVARRFRAARPAQGASSEVTTFA